jgi:hypothetical protein
MKWQTVDDENPRAGLEVAVRVGEDDSMVARRFPTATGYRWLYGPADGGQWEGAAPTHWAPLVVAVQEQRCPIEPVGDALVVVHESRTDWLWRVVKPDLRYTYGTDALVVIEGPTIGPVTRNGVEYYCARVSQVIGVVTP